MNKNQDQNLNSTITKRQVERSKLSKPFPVATKSLKIIALILFITLPFIGFVLGTKFQSFQCLRNIGIDMKAYDKNTVSNGSDTQPSNSNLIPTPSVVSRVVSASKINKLLSYSKPPGWKLNEYDNYISIQSPDFIRDMSGINILQGMEIGINAYTVIPGDTIEKKKKDWANTAGVSEIKETVIDDAWAFKFYASEGDSYRYYVIKGDYAFMISFHYANIDAEKQYSTQIEDFINSISFKER